MARCGTTSLYNYLNQHPNICFSAQKEPKFFSSLDISLQLCGKGDFEAQSEMILTEEEYFDGFSHCDKPAVGEASSDYFYYHKKTIPRIKQYLGDPKIIIVLRNPYERSFSAYSNMIRDSREELGFLEGLQSEDYRKNSNYDWMWFYRSGSLYADGVKSFTESFSNVHIVLNDDLSKNTQNTLKKCFDFLDVNNDFVPPDLTRYSNSGRPKNHLIKFISRRSGPMFKIRRFVIKVIPRNYLEFIAKKMFVKEQIDRPALDLLRDEFNSDISRLEELLNIELTHWKR